MRKTYIKPLIEAQELGFESHLMAASVTGANGLGDDVTPGDNKPTDFSKGHSSIWDFDEEE